MSTITGEPPAWTQRTLSEKGFEFNETIKVTEAGVKIETDVMYNPEGDVALVQFINGAYSDTSYIPSRTVKTLHRHLVLH